MKTLAGLDCKVENREIKLICDNDCPLIHIKEALFQFSKYIGQIEDTIKNSKKDSEKSENLLEKDDPNPE